MVGQIPPPAEGLIIGVLIISTMYLGCDGTSEAVMFEADDANDRVVVFDVQSIVFQRGVFPD